MKRYFLSALALVFCFTISLAQGGTVENHLANLDETYSFSDDQEKQLTEILNTRQVQINQISELKETNKEEYKSQLIFIKEQTLLSFQDLLNTEQIGIYRAEMTELGSLRRSWIAKAEAEGMSPLDIQTALAEQLF